MAAQAFLLGLHQVFHADHQLPTCSKSLVVRTPNTTGTPAAESSDGQHNMRHPRKGVMRTPPLPRPLQVPPKSSRTTQRASLTRLCAGTQHAADSTADHSVVVGGGTHDLNGIK